MKNIKTIIWLLVALASLWGAFYARSILEPGHWAIFPAAMTLTIVFSGSIVMAIFTVEID